MLGLEPVNVGVGTVKRKKKEYVIDLNVLRGDESWEDFRFLKNI